MTPEQLAEYKKQSIEGGGPSASKAPTIHAPLRIENGEIVIDGKASTSPRQSYATSKLLVEYKALPDGDSGIYLRGVPQVQIWDSTRRPAGLGQELLTLNNDKGSPGKDPLVNADNRSGMEQVPASSWSASRVRRVAERPTRRRSRHPSKITFDKKKPAEPAPTHPAERADPAPNPRQRNPLGNLFVRRDRQR